MMNAMLRTFWPGVVWFIFSGVAFFLPGSALPNNDWFGKIELDKIIHIVLFTFMVILWSIPFLYKSLSITRLAKILILVPTIFFAYSIVVEFVQLFFISGRSFDLFDILADGIGCAIGFLFVKYHQRYSTGSK